MSANDRQVGGSHYRSPIQHWDYVAANDLDYFQGQITKYVSRWKEKNGVQDLEKAQHFLQKYIEIEKAKIPVNSAPQPELPPVLHSGEAYKDDLQDGWTVEGFYGDMTQNYKCPFCRAEVRAVSFGHALKQHDTCSGSKLSVP